MADILDEAHPLLAQMQKLCEAPPPGVTPWYGMQLLEIFKRAIRYYPERGALYLEFMEGARDLLQAEEEDALFRRFTEQSIAAESRVMADDPGVRDHLTHVVQVFLTGWIILNRCTALFCDDVVFRPYRWDCSPKERFKRLNRAWLYAGLLHDVAYSVQEARDSYRHEVMVKGLFGDLYKPGLAGRPIEVSGLAEAADPLWHERNTWLGDAALPARRVRSLLDSSYRRAQHSIVGAVALWREAEAADQDIQTVLKPAAAAVACHDFVHLLHPERGLEDEANRWLRLDLSEEPVAVLLHLCDELQEWSRERADESVSHRQASRSALRYAATELRELEVSTGYGVSIETTLRRRLRVEDRHVATLARRHEERAIAEKRRKMRVLLAPRTAPPDLRPHLRVTYLVEDLPCRNVLTVDWPEPTPRVQRAGKEHLPETLPSLPHTVSVRLEPEGDHASLSLELQGAETSVATEAGSGGLGVRCVLVAPGGAGKSTLLSRIAPEIRLGHRRARTLYLEQLPAEPFALDDLVEGVRKEHSDRDVLLLVDHLDRLVEDELGEYWLDQLRSLPAEPWLHVIGACRPEEYKNVVSGALAKSFRRADLVGPTALLVNGRADTEGRALPEEIERLLRSNRKEDLWALAALASSMGTARVTEQPVPSWTSGGEPRFRDAPLLLSDERQRHRFAHDVLQDFLSALHLARMLSGAHEKIELARELVLELEELPRDVPRLLFGLLANRRGKLLGQVERRRAALALARGLLWEPTTRQWCYDTSRLDQSAEAIESFELAYCTDRLAHLVSTRLMGDIEFGRIKYADLSSPARRARALERAERSIELMTSAAQTAEQLLVELGPDAPPEARWPYRWVLAFTADHLLRVLSRIYSEQAIRSEALRLATEAAAQLRKEKAPHAVEPGWLRSMLDRLSVQTNYLGFDEVFKSTYEDFKSASTATDLGRRWLDVRRCMLCGHIGVWLIHESSDDAGTLERMREGATWYARSIAIRGRVLRAMERSPGRRRTGESWGTLAQGLADVGAQYRGLFDSLIYSYRFEPRQPDLCFRLVEAHMAHRRAWDRARVKLGKTERLSIHYRTCIGCLALGEVLEQRLADPGRKGTIEEDLDEQGSKLLEDFHINAEEHPRYPEDVIYEYLEKKLGPLPDLIENLLREARG